MKRLLLLCGLLGLLAVPASAATEVYSISGATSWGQQLSGTFTNPATQDLTATATFQGSKRGSYVLHLYHPNGSTLDQFCVANTPSGAITSLSCTIPNAIAAEGWTVDFYPVSGGKIADATVTVTGP